MDPFLSRQKNSPAESICRVVVLGANKMRMKRILSLLSEPDLQALARSEDGSLSIVFLPCVATFDSYEDENGNDVRYLVSVNYHPDVLPEGDSRKDQPSSLLEVFDQQVNRPEKKVNEEASALDGPLFTGIAGVAAGSGIESQEDIDKIAEYFTTMASTSNPDKAPENIPIECIKPGKAFRTMKEEMCVYRAMDSEEKERATVDRSMGPAKMAKFVAEFTRNLVEQKLKKRTEAHEREAKESLKMTKGIDTVSEAECVQIHEISPDKDRFACRNCRHILFGEDDFQDPPHVPSQHDFGYHKYGSGQCQSYFLQDGLEWMGGISDAAEGKFSCPKCHSKLGTWHWSGAQCSCGTWVVPAIQVPKSRVDLIPPQTSELPEGAVVSPLLFNQTQQQHFQQSVESPEIAAP